MSTLLDFKYVIITREILSSHLFAANPYLTEYLRCIMALPQSVTQLADAIFEIQFNWQTCIHRGYNLTILSPSLIIERMEKSIEKDGIAIVFIEKGLEKSEVILDFFDKNDIFYYVNVSKDSMKGTYFDDVNDLIVKIKNDYSKIKNHLTKHGIDFKPKFEDEIPEYFRKKFSEVASSLTVPNFFMLNQYIGYIWYDVNIQQKIALIDELPNQSELLSEQSPINIDHVINQILQFDKFRGSLQNYLPFIEKYLDRQPQYTPLILIAPFFFDYFSNKGIRTDSSVFDALSKIEQDQFYNLQLPSKAPGNKEDTLSAELEGIIINRLRYLDNLAYLHGSFTFSPVVRLPIQGKGINRFLSFFNPDGKAPSQEKLFATIKRFGNYLSSHGVNPKLAAELFRRNRQLVVISNLPLEWMIHDEICLNFTHDITRIPEMPYHGIMAHYLSNQRYNYSVPKDIMSKTLVIFGSPNDKNFKSNYSYMQARGSKLGFKTAYCNSIQELKNLIHSFNPHLLIFDTHGDTNPDKKTTELKIGNETLMGEDIIELKIVAPLIILSACNTAPNWGYFNHITNAFFQAGAKSVTGTYLPIGIASGTILYNRILANLEQCGVKPFHNNWLDFLSHNIRSYYITENMLFYLKKSKELKLPTERKKALSQQINTLASRLMADSMYFHKRKSVFMNLRTEFSNIHPSFKNSNPQITHEQLLYTNLGRGDLIYFDCWLEDNAMKPPIIE
jgi:hypothetical protein